MIPYQSSRPESFKGIALFTPGGDLIYGIDYYKQARWHIHLCIGLQEILGLSEPPHFLIPGYTATVDVWLDPLNKKPITIAEIYPAVQRYQSLLQVIFGTKDVLWQVASWQEEHCDPIIIETYRHQFPELWEDHDLIVGLNPSNPAQSNQNSLLGRAKSSSEQYVNFSQGKQSSQLYHTDVISVPPRNTEGYILRLFISSDNSTVEKTLASIHHLLEDGLAHPYTLKVIDISQHPEQAEIHQIAATPTLVRVWPQPVRRIVGELDDLPRVLRIISSY